MSEVYLDLIKKTLDEKKHEQCEDLLLKAKAAFPELADLEYYSAKLYHDMKKYEEALGYISNAIAQEYKVTESYRLKVKILAKIDKFEEALAICNHVLEKEPKNYMFLYTKGTIKFQQKEYSDAIQLFREAVLKKGRKFIEAQEEMIKAYCKLRNYNKTFQCFNEFYPQKNAYSLRFKASLYKEFRDFDQAMQLIDEAIRFAPDREIKELIGDKIVYMYYNGQYENCITEGTKMIKNQKEMDEMAYFSSLLFYVGCAYLRIDKSKEAEEHFEEYLKYINPKNIDVDYYVEKARILISKKASEEEANELIDKALKIDPNNVNAIKFRLDFLETKRTFSSKESEDYDECYSENAKIEEEINMLNMRLEKLEENKVNINDVFYDCNSQAFMIKTTLNSEMINSCSIGNNNIITTNLAPKDNIIIRETSNNADIINLPKLGSGGFGSVYISHIYTGEKIAIKRFNNNVLLTALDEKELRVLQEIKHENIVQYKGFYESDILMELCEGGDVYSLVIKDKVQIPIQFKYKILKQIANALNYLHNTKQIIHGDIKNQNILLDQKYVEGSSTYPNAKLCDFGLAAFKNDPINAKIGYSLYYAAPEALINDGKVDIKSDIYSFGMTMYELISRESPFSSMEKEQIVNMVKRGIHPNFNEKLKEYPQVLIDLLNNCCKSKPEDRPDISKVHQILQSLDI